MRRLNACPAGRWVVRRPPRLLPRAHCARGRCLNLKRAEGPVMKKSLVLLLVLALPACNTIDLSQLGDIGTTLNQAFVPADANEEKEIGNEAAAVLLGAAPVLNDPT